MRYFLLLLFLCGCINDRRERVPEFSPVETPYQQSQAMEIPTLPSPPPATHSAPPKREFKSATQEMAEAIMLAKLARRGDITLEFADDNVKLLRELQSFFGHYFVHDGYTFWFTGIGEQKITIDNNHGKLDKCVYGIFPPGLKRMVTFQNQDRVRTEFYLDFKNDELMVHHYVDDRRVNHKNYKLQ